MTDGPAVPVQHGTRPHVVPKKRPIDYYRQMPFCRPKDKEKDVFEYKTGNAPDARARLPRPRSPRAPFAALRGFARERGRC